MNVLIVTAHPSSRGFTHCIAEEYRKGAESNGDVVTILDLYAPEHRQEYFRFEEAKFPFPDPLRDFMQREIARADELVIIHPLWWFDAPAIMKNWFDTNFTSGFAYKYHGTFVPQRLLKGKTARIFITADGPSWFYFFIKPFKWNWWLGRLWICGIRLKSFWLLTKKRTRTPEYLEKWLRKVRNISGRKK